MIWRGFLTLSLISMTLFAAGEVLHRQAAPSRPTCHAVARSTAPVDPHAGVTERDPAVDALVMGLWSSAPRSNGDANDPVSFYYFHDGGIGLYRTGRLGHNTTHSYTWALTPTPGAKGHTHVLTLRYNKTGEHQRLAVQLGDVDGARTLTVWKDPQHKEATSTRYVWQAPPVAAATAPDLSTSTTTAPNLSTSIQGRPQNAPGIDNRLWMDLQRYATGGMGFQLYQLNKAGIDGRGMGWHHVGDFDDWSTEALSYRLLRDEGQVTRLELVFARTGERTITDVRLLEPTNEHRRLRMTSDPRGFWASHDFVDAGPSFGQAGLAQLLLRRR